MILSIIAKIYAITFMLCTIAYKKIHLTKKQFIFFGVLFVLSLSVMTYNMIPPSNWDIFVHFRYMDQIRTSGMSLLEFLFQNGTIVGGKELHNLYVFNFLRYFIIHISSNNYLLPAVCVFIDYLILGYIILDWSSSTGEGYKINLLTLLLSFTFLPYVHASSGMRNALCASIMGLAVYLYLYKKKHIMILAMLVFMAATVHPAGIITVPFIFLAKLNIGIVGYITVLITPILAQFVAQLFINSGITYFVIIGYKYFSYTSENQYRSSRVPLYGDLIIVVIFLLIYFMLYKPFNVKEELFDKKLMYNFIVIYMLYILGNIGNYDMVLRPAYVFGPLAPVLNSFFSGKKIWSYAGISQKTKSILNFVAITGTLIVCLYVNYNFLINYGIYF